MTDRSLPEPATLVWQDKPITTRDARHGRQPGLLAFLDRIRQRPYVTGLETAAFYPRLVVDTAFARVPDDPARVEGWFAAFAEESTTRFWVATTARTDREQQAVLDDLREHLLGR